MPERRETSWREHSRTGLGDGAESEGRSGGDPSLLDGSVGGLSGGGDERGEDGREGVHVEN